MGETREANVLEYRAGHSTDEIIPWPTLLKNVMLISAVFWSFVAPIIVVVRELSG